MMPPNAAVFGGLRTRYHRRLCFARNATAAPDSVIRPRLARLGVGRAPASRHELGVEICLWRLIFSPIPLLRCADVDELDAHATSVYSHAY